MGTARPLVVLITLLVLGAAQKPPEPHRPTRSCAERGADFKPCFFAPGSETRGRHDQEPCKNAAAGCTCQDDNDPLHGINRTAICALTCSSAGSKHTCSPLMSPVTECPLCCTDSYWNDTKACSVCYELECPPSDVQSMCRTMTGTAMCQMRYLEYCVFEEKDFSVFSKGWDMADSCMDPENFRALKQGIITASTTFGVAIPYVLRFLVDFAWDWLWAGLMICCPCCCKRRDNERPNRHAQDDLEETLLRQRSDSADSVDDTFATDPPIAERKDPGVCMPQHVYEVEPPGFTMNMLMDDKEDHASGEAVFREETNWEKAIEKNGISLCGAISAAAKRFVFWHMIQPGMYYVVLSVYWDNLNEQGACSDGTSTTRAACEGTDPAGTWTADVWIWDLGSGQQVLALLVLLREALYVLLLLVAVAVNPAFLLVDVPASVKSNGEGVHHPVAGYWFLAMYVVAPEKFVALALVQRHGALPGSPGSVRLRDEGLGAYFRPRRQLWENKLLTCGADEEESKYRFASIFRWFFTLFVVFDLCGLAALVVGVYQRFFAADNGTCSDGTSTTRAACEGTDPAGTWTTEASLRLPDALFVCYVVSTLSGLYFFVFALSKRIRCRCRCCSASEDSGSGDEQDPELEVEPQPEPAAGGGAAGASRRLPPQFPGGAE